MEAFVQVFKGKKAWEKKWLKVGSSLQLFTNQPKKGWFGKTKGAEEVEEEYSFASLKSVSVGDPKAYKKDRVLELTFGSDRVIFQAANQVEYLDYKSQLEKQLSKDADEEGGGKDRKSARDDSEDSSSSGSSASGSSSTSSPANSPSTRKEKSAGGDAGGHEKSPLARRASLLEESGQDALGVSLHTVGVKRSSMSGSQKRPGPIDENEEPEDLCLQTMREKKDIRNASGSKKDFNSSGKKDFHSSEKQSPDKKERWSEKEGTPADQRKSLSGKDRSPVKPSAKETSSKDTCSSNSASNSSSSESPLPNRSPSVMRQVQEISYRWDERLRYAMRENPQALSDLLGDFMVEAIEYSKKFIDALCFGQEDEQVEETRSDMPGMETCAFCNGIFYRIIVDVDDYSKDETEIALNGAEVRSIRYLVSNMVDHIPKAQTCPFNGYLMISVDYAGFRVFCQAAQPLEQCTIAAGWYPDNKGKVRYIEPDSATRDAMKLVQETLNLKRTNLKLKDTPNPKRIRLPPSQLLHRDKNGQYYMGRQLTPLLVPLAKEISDVDAHALNFLRPEAQTKLSFPVSPVLGYDFCASCVEAVPDSEHLKKEVVEAYGEVGKAVQQLIEELDNGKRFPVDSSELRKHFHSAGVNIIFLGQVYQSVTLPYIKHLCLCDAIARVIKRGVRECCHSTQDKNAALSYCTSWFNNVLQYDAGVWTSIREWLQKHYTFAACDVVDVDFSQSIHAPILLQCMAHHASVRVDTEKEMLPTLRKEWRKVGVFLEFVPSVKTLCYRKASHSMLLKDRWATQDFVQFVEFEQKLAKAWLGGGKGDANQVAFQAGGTMTRSQLQDMGLTGSISGSRRGLTSSAKPALAKEILEGKASLEDVPDAGAVEIGGSGMSGSRPKSVIEQSYPYIIDKSGFQHGLDQALKLYVDHVQEADREEAATAARFALTLYEEDPNLWLNFASQAWQYELPIPGLTFEEVAHHIEYNFGEDHPLLLDFYRQKLDRLYGMVNEQQSSGLIYELIDVAEKCVGLAKAAFGRAHPTTAWYHSLMGHVLLKANKTEQAIEHYKRTLELSIKNKGPESHFVAGAYSCLRDAEIKRGDPERALDFALKGQKILEKLHQGETSTDEKSSAAPPPPPSKGKLLVNMKHICNILEMRGHLTDALEWTQRLLTLLQATDIDLNRGSFDFAVVLQTVRLTICSTLDQSQKVDWERRCHKIDKEQRNQVVHVNYQWTISDLAELPEYVRKLLAAAEDADIIVAKKATDEVFQLLKWCDPEFVSMFECQMTPPANIVVSHV